MSKLDEGVVWLASVVMGLPQLGDPELHTFKAALRPFKNIPSPSGQLYQLYLTSSSQPLVQSDTFRLYVCELSGGKQFGVMKVAANTDRNGEPLSSAKVAANTQSLREEAALLKTMRHHSTEFDRRMEANGEAALYHHSFFPEVVDAFTTGDERYAVVLGYPRAIKTMAQLPAISRLMGKSGDRQRIDLKSAWVYGKTLKALNFAHQLGIMNNNIGASNVLISPEEHAVIIFDWRAATQGDLSISEKREEVVKAAEVFVRFAGGRWDGESLSLPHDAHLMSVAQHSRFVEHFARILSGDCGSAYAEHSSWYALLDSVWPRGFHEFKLYPANEEA